MTMVAREELLVSAVPLVLRVERGPQAGALRVLVRSLDLIPVPPLGGSFSDRKATAW